MEPVLLLRWEGLAFVLGLAALLVYRMLTGRINLNGLLRDDGANVSPERVQLLVATIAVSFKVLSGAVHGNGNSLPDVSPQTLMIFGASGGVYAAVKAFKSVRAK